MLLLFRNVTTKFWPISVKSCESWKHVWRCVTWFLIELHCVESSRVKLCITIGVNHIVLAVASYIALMYRIGGSAWRCVSWWPYCWKCTSLASWINICFHARLCKHQLNMHFFEHPHGNHSVLCFLLLCILLNYQFIFLQLCCPFPHFNCMLNQSINK